MTIVVRCQSSRVSRRWAKPLSWALVCALCAMCVPVSRVGAQVESAPGPPSFAPDQVEDELSALRGELEEARFTSAAARAQSLLTQRSLSARQRNGTLELLAIAQIAARADAAAENTLRELFARDPDHVAGVRDPGPNVAATFERVRSQTARALSVPLTLSALRDTAGRVIVEVTLGVGHDAVDSVHVFARAGTAARSPTAQATASTAHTRAEQPPAPTGTAHDVALSGAATSERTSDATAPAATSHLVADVGVRSTLALALPPAELAVSSLAVYVEARAPSGAVLGRDGSAETPLIVRLDAPPRRCNDVPLRQRWWLWTSVALAVSGIAIAGALAAH